MVEVDPQPNCFSSVLDVLARLPCLPQGAAGWPQKLTALDLQIQETIKHGGDLLLDHGDAIIKALQSGEEFTLARIATWFKAHPDFYDLIDMSALQGKTVAPLPMGELVEHLRRLPVNEHPDVKESDGTGVRYLKDAEFKNWGRTVDNTPHLTFFPRTKLGVQNTVKCAIMKGYQTVRGSGYRHSWSNIFSRDGQVLVAMLPLAVTDDLPARKPCENELMGIELVGDIVEDGELKKLCKIGAAATNEMFRRWAVQNGWTVPCNVIMVDITFGGSNAPICHGAGLGNKTLSDLVHSVEFVNARGEFQVVSDQEQLKAAAGCFGMLGIVVSLTLKLIPMKHAVLYPEKKPTPYTIPPPKGIKVPNELRVKNFTDRDHKLAEAAFETNAQASFYAEWFWFVGESQCWQNCWGVDDATHEATEYPSKIQAFEQSLEEYLAQLLNEFFGHFPAIAKKYQAKILASSAQRALLNVCPNQSPIVTPLIDALHFRRGIQNMRVLDMEWEIPIPDDGKGGPDWSVCQRAWWDVITLFYDDNHADSFRLVLEMRLFGGSDITMAPVYGNKHGTCSIEILTPANVDLSEWHAFCQAVLNKWASYKDSSGNFLNIRPHWAKQWERLCVRGMPVTEYLRDHAYKDRIPEFQRQLAAVARAGGYGKDDLKPFSCPLVREVVGM